jgi:hypothetical protein
MRTRHPFFRTYTSVFYTRKVHPLLPFFDYRPP